MTITIQSVNTIEECRLVGDLQQRIWDSADIDVVPDHLMITIAKESGMVLLVYDETNQPIGFVLAFLGLYDDHQLKLVSHQVGVLPEYQDKNWGYQIKLAQRDLAIQRNIDLISWTFDPLQSRNARLNLHKLGAVCNAYFDNLYGTMRNFLNQGLPSDRFRADWWITSDHVKQRLSESVDNFPAEYTILNQVAEFSNGIPIPAQKLEPIGNQFCLVETPADITRLKDEAPSLAQEWQQQIRYLFTTTFDHGYTAIDLLRRDNHVYYLLQKNWHGKSVAQSVDCV
jgi:predicted GNAT superfamily acetyltransferase